MPQSPLSTRSRKLNRRAVTFDVKPKEKPTDYDQEDLADCFERLYDPDDYSYLPMDQQVAKYSKRNLLESKVYKTALNVYNVSAVRQRTFTSDHMRHQREQTTVPERLSEKYAVWDGGLARPQLEKAATTMTASEAENYRERMKRRVKLREDLNDLGNVAKFLRAKDDRTPIEQAYLKRLDDEERARRRPKTPPPAPKAPPPPRITPDIKSPPPLALQAIDKHIHEKRWRLLELFEQADLNKRWKLSVSECMRIVEGEQLPISKALVEQLVFELDKDDKGEVDYRDLARGLLRYQREERPAYRYSSAHSHKSRSTDRPSSTVSTTVSTLDGRASVNRSRARTPADGGTERGDHASESASASASASRPASRSSTATSSRHLAAPAPDTRPDAYEHRDKESQVDARRAEMNILRFDRRCKEVGVEPTSVHSDKFVVRVGYKPWDDHVAPSTLRGASGLNDSVDRYRQKQFREYLDLLELCKHRGIPLSEALLERVLLHPADRPHESIAQHVAAPDSQLLTKNTDRWAAAGAAAGVGVGVGASVGLGVAAGSNTPGGEPAPESDTESESVSDSERLEAKKRPWVDRSTGLIDLKRAFPKYRRVAPREQHVMLVTGPATIKRSIDNWMSFEEYLAYTEHLKRRTQLHGLSKKDSFWPGYMLSKLRLCMPPHDSKYSFPARRDVFFQSVPNEMH